jgi:hypothetical protein
MVLPMLQQRFKFQQKLTDTLLNVFDWQFAAHKLTTAQPWLQNQYIKQ